MMTVLPDGWKRMTEDQKMEWMKSNIGRTEMPENWGQMTEEHMLDWLEINMEKISTPRDLEAIIRDRQAGDTERDIALSFLLT